MTEILHAWAFVPAAIGTCCLAADRRRARAPELAASVVMLIAMLDSALAGVLAPAFWCALLLAGGMGLAALRRRRGPAVESVRADRMSLHTAIGMVVMAALLVGMGHEGDASEAHAHGMGRDALTLIMFGGAALFAAGSFIAAARESVVLGRAQFAAMAASTLLMATAAVG